MVFVKNPGAHIVVGAWSVNMARMYCRRHTEVVGKLKLAIHNVSKYCKYRNYLRLHHPQLFVWGNTIISQIFDNFLREQIPLVELSLDSANVKIHALSYNKLSGFLHGFEALRDM